MNFIEWIDNTAFASKHKMPATSVTPHWLGAYAAASLYLNPLKVPTNIASWPNTDLAFARTQLSGSEYVSGFINNISYYAGGAGTYKKEFKNVITSNVFMDILAGNTKAFNDFTNGKAKDYNTDKDDYNKKTADEKARRADIFKATFEPAIKIPKRPCPPTPPTAVKPLNLDYNEQIEKGTAYPAFADDKVGYAYFVDAAGSTTFSAAAGLSHGFIQVSADGTGLASDAGKIMGVFGQGDNNVAMENGKAYQMRKVQSAGVSGMYISIYPNAVDATGLALGKLIDISVMPQKWSDYSEYAFPGSPAQPGDPDKALGAKVLAATVTAAAAVLVSLY